MPGLPRETSGQEAVKSAALTSRKWHPLRRSVVNIYKVGGGIDADPGELKDGCTTGREKVFFFLFFCGSEEEAIEREMLVENRGRKKGVDDGHWRPGMGQRRQSLSILTCFAYAVTTLAPSPRSSRDSHRAERP